MLMSESLTPKGMKTKKQWRAVDKWVFTSAFLYVIACLTPTGCHINYGGDVVLGFVALWLGWLMVFVHIGPFLAWSSNIFYFLAVIDLVLKGVRDRTVVFSMMALLLAISWFFMCSFFDGSYQCHVGYYFWVTSYLVLFIATLKFWFGKVERIRK